MPSKSEKQKIAMQLAAAGKSNIGIPQSVGMEYVKADKAKGNPCKPKRKGGISKGLAAAFARNNSENNMDT